MNKKQRQERLAAIVKECEAILAKEDQTAEDSARFDELSAEAEAHEKALAQIDALEKRQAFQNHRPGPRVVSSPSPSPAEGVEVVLDEGDKDPRRGFASFADFALAVKDAFTPGMRTPESLLPVAAPSNYQQSSGDIGYMVPPQYSNEVFDLVFNEEDLLRLFDPEPTDLSEVKMPLDEDTPWGSSGVQAYWGQEAGQMSASKLNTKQVSVELHKLYAFVLATEELLSDAPRLSNRLTKASAAAIRWKASNAYMFGTGVGQPEGLFNSAAKVTVAKESGQAAATIVAANILKMYAALLSGPRSFFAANSDTLPQVGTMTIGNQPVWLPPAQGMQSAPDGSLCGKALHFTDHCETLGTVGDILMINPDGYYGVIKRGGMNFAQSAHLYFDYDMQAFRWTFRIGGRPKLSQAVTPNKGTSKSHFVALATRS